MSKLKFTKDSMAFNMRRKIAESIASKNPGMLMSTKFKLATGITKKKLKRGKK